MVKFFQIILSFVNVITLEFHDVFSNEHDQKSKIHNLNAYEPKMRGSFT